MFSGMICHELLLVVLLHMRPSQARRLDNIRVLCHRLESSSRLSAPATRTPLEIYQQLLEIVWCAGFCMLWFLAGVLIAVGIAWPNRLAVFAICISVSQFVTSERARLSRRIQQHGHWLCWM